ncbi:MAG: efflux RND transporter permease subunit [Candidatus Pacebacteria bacterium]|nr:efflux RND transporter permease subunit [Candidatus Paceibacterota bacterium]
MQETTRQQLSEQTVLARDDARDGETSVQDINDSVNWIGKVARVFVENRSLSLLAIVLAIVLGVIGFLSTPKQYNPQITRPAFIVEVSYPGATVDEGYRLVATELAEKVHGLTGVDEVTVQVRDGAHITAVVIFDVGFSKDTAKVSLQTQLAQHSYLARGAIRQPTVRELNPDEVPILTVRLTSSEHSLAFLRERAISVSHALTSVPGVAGVEVYGGYPPALVVELLPEELARSGASIDGVLAALADAGTEYPLIALSDGSRQVVLDIESASMSPETLAQVGVTETVRLGDIARIYRGTEEVSSYVRVMYPDIPVEDAVLLSVAKRESASAPVVSEAVLTALGDALAGESHGSVSFEVVNDDGVMASEEIQGLMVNLVQSIVIVGLVLVLFLSPRSALVVGLSIPFTMLVVFALGYVTGQTVNRITLFALILSLGLLVDAAIVVVEAMHVAIAGGASPRERVRTVVQAIHSVGVGLFLSMLTSVIVFMPMLFITGMMGPYMAPIAFFVPAALVVSFFVAVTVMPYLALGLMRGDEKKMALAALLQRGLDWVTHQYGLVLTWILRSRVNQRAVLGGALVAFVLALSIPMLQFVHFQMLPKADRDQYFIHIDMPAGTDVVATKVVAESVAQLALADEHTRAAQLFIATPQVLDFNGMFKGAHLRTAPHQATIRVSLVSKGERGDASTDIVERARGEYVKSGIGTQVKQVRFIEDPPGPPVAATFVAKVSGGDRDARTSVARGISDVLAKVDGTVDLDTSIEGGYARMVLAIDHAAVRTYGVDASDVFSALALLGAPVEGGQFHAEGLSEYAPIEVRVPRSARTAPSDLSYVMVRSHEGVLVPIESLVTMQYERSRDPLLSEGATLTQYVTAETQGRSIVYVMLDVMKLLRTEGVAGYAVVSWDLFGMVLENEGGTESVRIDWGGEWEMTLENFRDLGLAMFAALFFVYAILVAQYRNFRTPALILVTVPVGLVGILCGFAVLDAVADVPLTATALIGFIALIGIVVNNAIIFLERFDEVRQSGLTYDASLFEAASSRLRPILLTSLTTVLGSLTIAFDPVWSGLAWAIVFGLSLSTVLTLVLLPTLLVYTKKDDR